MTRKSTTSLRQQIAAQEASDDALASKLQALMGWIEKAERNRHERDDAIKAAIDEDRAAYLGELRVMKAEIAASIAELRGTPVQIDAGEVKQLQAAE
jgi:hypothetical protein